MKLLSYNCGGKAMFKRKIRVNFRQYFKIEVINTSVF